MFYIGFDQALSSTGWAIAKLDSNNKTFQILETNTIRTKLPDTDVVRLIKLKTEVMNVITKYSPKPEMIFLETIFKPRAAAGSWDRLIKVDTVLQIMFYELGIPITLMSPKLGVKNSWRTLINVGNEKQDMTRFMGSAHRNQHSSDAVGILLGGCLYNKLIKPSEVETIINGYRDRLHQLLPVRKV